MPGLASLLRRRGVKGYSHGGPSIHSGHGSVSATPGMPGWMTTWKRGRTIGDLTGGGGRSIMPTRRPRGRGPVPTAPTRPTPPGGWQAGGHVKGYQGGGRAGELMGFRGGPPLPPMPQGWQPPSVPVGPNILIPPRPIPPRRGGGPGGWQAGGEVGVAPEEVAMASEIFARATPEQQDQITGGGGPGMMDEEAAIGEALAMAMGGGGGGPPMGGPPMGGPPMNGAPPMGGLI